MPCEFLKCLIAEPTAVSSCDYTDDEVLCKNRWHIFTCNAERPSSVTFCFAKTSNSIPCVSITRLRAELELISEDGSVERDVRTFEIYPDVIGAKAFELFDWEKNVLNTSESGLRAQKKIPDSNSSKHPSGT